MKISKSNSEQKYIQHCHENSERIISAYLNTHEQSTHESEKDYIDRIAEQDYDDGYRNGAVFQEKWNELHP